MQSCEWNALIKLIHQYPKQWKKGWSSEWNAVILSVQVASQLNSDCTYTSVRNSEVQKHLGGGGSGASR